MECFSKSFVNFLEVGFASPPVRPPKGLQVLRPWQLLEASGHPYAAGPISWPRVWLGTLPRPPSTVPIHTIPASQPQPPAHRGHAPVRPWSSAIWPTSLFVQ